MGSVATAEDRVWREVGAVPRARNVHLRRLGVDVRVQEVGDGPPALFLHGTSVTGTSWANLVAALPRVRCLLVDRPGCGDSDPLPGSVTLASLLSAADDLVADVLDALELETAAVVATSRGGLDALRGAAAHPHRVSRLLLFGWCMGAPGSRAPWWLRMGAMPGAVSIMARMPVGRRATRSMLARFGLRSAIDRGTMSAAMIDLLVALYRDTETLRHEAAAGAVMLDRRRGWRREVAIDAARLARIQAPTRLVWGTEDPFGDATVAQRLTSLLPSATLDLLAGAGHAPWLDEPAHGATIASDFLTPSDGSVRTAVRPR